jgi:hypothetical protein
MPIKVDRIFVKQPLDIGRGGLEPLGPPKPPRPLGLSGYFGLPMMNPSRLSLAPNKTYHWPLNYLEYVKDYDPNAHVRVFKATIRANGEIEDAKIVNLFNFTSKDIMFDWCNNCMGDYQHCIYVKL